MSPLQAKNREQLAMPTSTLKVHERRPADLLQAGEQHMAGTFDSTNAQHHQSRNAPTSKHQRAPGRKHRNATNSRNGLHRRGHLLLNHCARASWCKITKK